MGIHWLPNLVRAGSPCLEPAIHQLLTKRAPGWHWALGCRPPSPGLLGHFGEVTNRPRKYFSSSSASATRGVRCSEVQKDKLRRHPKIPRPRSTHSFMRMVNDSLRGKASLPITGMFSSFRHHSHTSWIFLGMIIYK